MTTNASPEYMAAQKKYLLAQTDEEKLVALEGMMKEMPGHKGAESLRADLRARYRKLKEDIESKKKKKKSLGKAGIRKEEMQAVLIGLTNSGKSSILGALTNAKPIISNTLYTTKQAFLGTVEYQGARIQLIDMPSIDAEFFDVGIANTADTLLVIINSPLDVEKIKPFISKTYGKVLIILNKIDLLTENEKRKYSSFLQSKKFDFVLFSAKTKENIDELKKKLWASFDKIRVYTKEPGKKVTPEPIVMDIGSNVREVAEKILHGFSKKITETRVTGPSSKFPNQKVGLDHILKDRDIVEFRTRD